MAFLRGLKAIGVFFFYIKLSVSVSFSQRIITFRTGIYSITSITRSLSGQFSKFSIEGLTLDFSIAMEGLNGEMAVISMWKDILIFSFVNSDFSAKHKSSKNFFVFTMNPKLFFLIEKLMKRYIHTYFQNIKELV